MMIIQNKYKKVADFCYELFRFAEIPLYSNKYSKKCYTQFQHIFLLVYKQYRKFTYRELMEDLSDNISLKTYLGLNKLPNYTTLIKFAKRLPCKILDKLLTAFKNLVKKPTKVAIDSTGLSLDNASPHYYKRIGISSKKRPFLKLSIIVDIIDYTILLSRVRKRPRHDTVDAKPMVKKLAKYYEPDVFYADRGYDDEKLFKLVFEELDAYPLILQKNLHVPKYKRKGMYRKQTFDVFDYGEYLQRNKVETAISMFKRKFGFSIRSRNGKLQKVEAFIRIIAYNIDRLIEKSIMILRIIILQRRIS